jgi:hypothetical protein
LHKHPHTTHQGDISNAQANSATERDMAKPTSYPHADAVNVSPEIAERRADLGKDASFGQIQAVSMIDGVSMIAGVSAAAAGGGGWCAVQRRVSCVPSSLAHLLVHVQGLTTPRVRALATNTLHHSPADALLLCTV